MSNSFFDGFEKGGAAKKIVAKAAIFHQGRLLMGVRQDNGRWTEPGGHLEGNETPLQGLIREVKEETGISLSKEDKLTHLGQEDVIGKEKNEPLTVHGYKVELGKLPKLNENKDPDHEVFGWNWISLKGGKLPKSILSNLHVPRSKNVLHKYLKLD